MNHPGDTKERPVDPDGFERIVPILSGRPPIAMGGSIVVIGAYGDDSMATGVSIPLVDNSLDKSGAAYVFE